MAKSFAKFKKDLNKQPLTFDFQIEEGENAKVYVAQTSNIQLLEINELMKESGKLTEKDYMVKFLEVFLEKEDAKEVFDNLNIQGIEEVLTELMSVTSGIDRKELEEVAKASNSPR